MNQSMREPEDKSPAEVLRAKRLEVVDDEGKVRAALGTDEKGIGGLSVYDESGRLRASLEAGEIPGEASGLSVFDANGKPRAIVGMHNDPDQNSYLTLLDTERANTGPWSACKRAVRRGSASQPERKTGQ